MSPRHCYRNTCDEKEGREALVEDVVAGGGVRKTAQQGKARQCHWEAGDCHHYALNQHLRPAFLVGWRRDRHFGLLLLVRRVGSE